MKRAGFKPYEFDRAIDAQTRKRLRGYAADLDDFDRRAGTAEYFGLRAGPGGLAVADDASWERGF